LPAGEKEEIGSVIFPYRTEFLATVRRTSKKNRREKSLIEEAIAKSCQKNLPSELFLAAKSSGISPILQRKIDPAYSASKS